MKLFQQGHEHHGVRHGTEAMTSMTALTITIKDGIMRGHMLALHATQAPGMMPTIQVQFSLSISNCSTCRVHIMSGNLQTVRN